MAKEIKNKGLKKFLKISKSYFLSVFTGMFVAFAIFLVIVSCQPSGRTYILEMDILSQTIKMELELKKDSKTFILCEYVNGELFAHQDGNYKITNGELYSIVSKTGGDVIEKEGKINAYEFTLDTSSLEDVGFTDEQMDILKNLKLVCKTNVTLRTISIVFMSIYGFGALVGLVVLILDKSKVINLQDEKRIE